jgi:long-chain acyl-CoA synthetase
MIFDDILQLCKEHKLSGLERPKDIYLHSEPFSIDNNLLTPTFKLKRNVANQVFKP